MIALYWFLLAWMVCIAFFGLMALISIGMNLQFGLEGAGTYVSTTVFVLVSLAALLITANYLFTVDWQQSVSIIPSFSGTYTPIGL